MANRLGGGSLVGTIKQIKEHGCVASVIWKTCDTWPHMSRVHCSLGGERPP